LNSKEFISFKSKEISAAGIKIFPDDFLTSVENTTLILPSEALIMGNNFFGLYEVLTINGNSFCQTETLTKAKYIVYSGKQKKREIKIPVNEKDIEMAVKSYEKYLDDLLREIDKNYKSRFPESKDANIVGNEIFRTLNLSRL
jgi:hypothetical protein